MDDIKIIACYCIIDDVLQQLEHKSHCLAGVSDAEVLTIAVVAALYFQNHHERALFLMKGIRYISKPPEYIPLQPPLTCSGSVAGVHSRAYLLSLFSGRSLHHRLNPCACMQASKSRTLRPGTNCGHHRRQTSSSSPLLRVLHSQDGEVLRVAFASDMYQRGYTCRVPDAAGRYARPHCYP